MERRHVRLESRMGREGDRSRGGCGRKERGAAAGLLTVRGFGGGGVGRDVGGGGVILLLVNVSARASLAVRGQGGTLRRSRQGRTTTLILTVRG